MLCHHNSLATCHNAHSVETTLALICDNQVLRLQSVRYIKIRKKSYSTLEVTSQMVDRQQIAIKIYDSFYISTTDECTIAFSLYWYIISIGNNDKGLSSKGFFVLFLSQFDQFVCCNIPKLRTKNFVFILNKSSTNVKTNKY